MNLVVKIGGSLSIGSDGPKPDYFSEILPIIREIDKKNKLSVGIGGGQIVRDYAETILGFELSDEQKEECFIRIIDANVEFLSYLLDKKPLHSLEDYYGEEAVVGGITPGRSTDANAALVAKEMDADLFVVMTDVDGIYEKDPEEDSDAEKIDRLGFDKLEKIKTETAPLEYGVVDPKALEIIEENRIKTAVINGKDPENLKKVLEGKKVGTVIGE